MKSILFANYGVTNCGVHHYGKTLYGALQGSQRFRFACADVMDLSELDTAVGEHKCDLLMVNYHPQTLEFASPNMPPRYGIPVMAVMHEMTQAESEKMPRRFVHYYVIGDPTLRPANSYVFTTGRIIPAYENRKTPPVVPTIGSIGFSVGSKGYARLVSADQHPGERHR